MAEIVVLETTVVPVTRRFEFELPGKRDETFVMTFSVEVPNLEKAVQAFAEAVWEGYLNE